MDKIQGATNERGSKENLETKGKLNLAVTKLKEIIGKLPEKDRNRLRAEHTLRSVENALGNLGKGGAPQGKYSVSVEGYPGNPQAPYSQNEGVPVDELIDILKNYAVELNKNFPTKVSLEALKKKVKDLDEQYKLAIEVTDKARKYSLWEKARKEYLAAEEALDLGYIKQSKELDSLADELTKSSQSYFEAHYTKAHGEGTSAWTEEERNRQDLRTRHEAKLISLDYRATGNVEADYKSAMEVMKRRRELKLTEEITPEVVVPPVAPKVVPPKPEVKKAPENLLAVDVSDIAEQLARQRATERLNEILNKKGLKSWFVKKWYRGAEEFYRQRFVREELAKMQNQKNVFADPARQAEHTAEMQAELERFQEDLFRKSGGESKETLSDPKINAEVTALMREYATTKMSDADFDAKKLSLLQEINKKYPNAFGPGRLSADNFLESAREFRKVAEHAEGLARLDAGLKVDLGIAKRVVKTDANLKWIDKAIAGVQKIPILSSVLTPTVVGGGLSVLAYLGKKPASWIGGAAGVGAIFGAARRAKDLKVDVATHRMERAMGRSMDDFKDAKGRKINREKMEKYTYSTRFAEELKSSLSNAIKEARSGNTAALTDLVADAEARMSLAETKSIDLIEYEGERVLSQSRLELMRLVAEAKTQVSDKGALDKAIGDRMTVLSKEVGAVDKKFAWFRAKEAGKAAIIGAALGGTIGALAQEGLDKIGVHPPDGKQPALEKLWHYMRGETTSVKVPTDLTQMYSPLNNSNISVHVPQGTRLVENVTGMSSLVDSKTNAVLADNIVWGKDGQIVSFDEVVGSGVSVESKANQIQAASVAEYLQGNRHAYESDLQEVHRHAHLMNDTAIPDLNELKLKYGGVNGTGFDKAGNIMIDLKGLTSYGSFQGTRYPNIADLIQEGKIKLLITPDVGNQHEGIVVDGIISADGETVSIGAGTSYAQALFGKDSTGRLTHPGFLEAVIADDDGKYTPIATDPDGGRFAPGMIGGFNHIFHRSTDVGNDWSFPPIIPIFPRKPLENYKGTGDAKGFIAGKKGGEEEKPDTPNTKEGGTQGGIKEGGIGGGAGKEYGDDLSDPMRPITEFGRRLKDKAHVGTRGQQIKGDTIDFGAEYPNKREFYTVQQIASQVLYGQIQLLKEDMPSLQGKTRDEIYAYLFKKVQADREKYEGEEAKRKYAEIISKAYKAVDTIMNKYGEKGRSEMPSLDKIHLLGAYDYCGQAQKDNFKSTAICALDSGEIFVNMLYVERASPEILEEILSHAISHEVTHDTVANNYWGFEAEDTTDKIYSIRRSGLKFSRLSGFDKLKGIPILREKGRALNEAVTEELALEAYKASGGKIDLSKGYYVAERRVLKALQEKFKIDFRVFAEAVVNRRKLPELVKAMKQANDKADSGYVSMLLAIMDYESLRPNCKDTYPQTMSFIRGEQVNVDTDIYKHLGAKFVNPDGSMKDAVKKKYKIMTPMTPRIEQIKVAA